MANVKYDVVALSITLWFNKYGDHDHNGLMYVLQEHQDIINYIKNVQSGKLDKEELVRRKQGLILKYDLTGDTRRIEEWLPDTQEKARQPHPLIVPLVLRASVGDTITINLKNEIESRQVGIHLVGPGTDANNDGSHIGKNQSSLVDYGEEKSFIWQCDREGVFVFHDAGDFRGDEQGTNVHGLFGALVVEPFGARWTDPETGGLLSSGLYADVHQRSQLEIETLKQEGKLAPYPNANNPESLTSEYPEPKASFREFVVFFHDEPEWVPPHGQLETNPCDDPNTSQAELMHEHTEGSLMPISYRAEPMISRERELWRKMKAGEIDPHNIVVNEEQHHSSWLFGDPCTPIFKAYLGDPVRIRLVHAGVKETHVFHLHVYEWNAIPFQRESNIIDAITISPQVGYTIVPFYGAGNRQMVPGDVIWHCHLYPHFHHGMWGIFRTFDKLQAGIDGALFHSRTGKELTPAELAAINAIANCITKTRAKNQIVRQLGRYPDLTPIHKLVPLPDREAPPEPTLAHPGYPLFIAGEVGQKSYTPPWHKRQSKQDTFEGLPVTDYDYRQPTQLELNAFNHDPRPGELFTTFAYPDRDISLHKVAKSQTVKHNIDVLMTPIKYNDYGWWDPHGHLYVLADEDPGIKTFSELLHEAVHHATQHLQAEDPHITPERARQVVASRGVTIEPTKQQPLFLRCRKTEVMQLTLHNRLERYIAQTPFDSAWPKGIERNCLEFASYRGECGLHVHIVKFDPICADGASTGWNYLSAPRFGKKLVYRWWADEEFGTIFTHDHLFANYRQKHGLFGALLVEPEGATFHDPKNPSQEILVGQSAVVRYREQGQEKAYREFCFGNADWVPLFKKAAVTSPHSGNNMGAIAHGNAEMTENFVAQSFYEVKDKPKKILQKINITYGMPLEPPNMQDSHDDNGVFGVNYRCEPLHERPHDPSEWFNSKKFSTNADEHGSEAQEIVQYGDPNTAVFHTLPGEPVRLRLVQGSHEEQHSFQLHGLRWQRFWQAKNSPLRNQQTLGISEAFSFDLDRNYGAGDYLWKYSSAEDLWLGCWGIIRAHDSNSHATHKPSPLMTDYTPPKPLCPPPLEQCRRFKVITKAKTIPYSPVLKDPFGLVFNLVAWAEPGETNCHLVTTSDDEPLVLRCRQGEWVAIELVNQIPDELEVEPLAPELPHDDADRRISNKVSIHADLLTYDVIEHDGANVGFNQNSTVDNSQAEPKGEKSRTYYWLADRDVGAVLLQDMADFRNHRHHGLIGALVIEAPDTIPYAVADNTTTAALVPSAVCWHGARATIYHESTRNKTEEMVLLVQNGLRYFLHGNPALPIGDIPSDLGEDKPDTEDQGLKGFNYRSEPNSHERGYAFTPSTPVFKVKPEANVKLHLVGACDKPRNHSFTLHGHSWKEWEYLGEKSPEMSSTSGVTSGFVQTYYFTANKTPGDYMYRSGVLKYDVEQGLWGIMRVSSGY